MVISKVSAAYPRNMVYLSTLSMQGALRQVLRQDRAPLLYSLVFGEGVINDATAVALLRAVQARAAGLSPLP